MSQGLILASCSVCGDVHLRDADVVLRTYDRMPERNYYRFTCPTCRCLVVRDAGPEITKKLTARVKVEAWRVPSEVLETHVGPAISADDVLDLMLALDGL